MAFASLIRVSFQGQQLHLSDMYPCLNLAPLQLCHETIANGSLAAKHKQRSNGRTGICSGSCRMGM